MRSRNYRIDQLATLGKLVQRGLQLAHILTAETTAGCLR